MFLMFLRLFYILIYVFIVVTCPYVVIFISQFSTLIQFCFYFFLIVFFVTVPLLDNDEFYL